MPSVDLFDTGARRVLALAQQEAVRLHHTILASEHLLIALLLEGSSASRVLQSAGLEVSAARASLERVKPRGDPKHEYDEIRLSPGVRRIIELAAAEAKRVGSSRVTPDHVAVALTQDPEAKTILVALGLSPDSLRQGLLSRGIT